METPTVYSNHDVSALLLERGGVGWEKLLREFLKG